MLGFEEDWDLELSGGCNIAFALPWLRAGRQLGAHAAGLWEFGRSQGDYRMDFSKTQVTEAPVRLEIARSGLQRLSQFFPFRHVLLQFFAVLR